MWIDSTSAGSTPEVQPSTLSRVDGRPFGASKNGTTMGPFTPAGAWWMWARVGVAMADQLTLQQTTASAGLTPAWPLPSGSAGGTSLEPSRLAESWVGVRGTTGKGRSCPRMAPAGKSALWTLT